MEAREQFRAAKKSREQEAAAHKSFSSSSSHHARPHHQQSNHKSQQKATPKPKIQWNRAQAAPVAPTSSTVPDKEVEMEIASSTNTTTTSANASKRGSVDDLHRPESKRSRTQLQQEQHDQE